MLTRLDLQRLAQVRLDDALLLLRANRPSSAYYLAGYAIEFALKAWRSVAKILILGGSVWRYGRRIKMVDGSPFADVRKPRAAKREPYILDAAEIAKLRAALDVPAERLLIELTLTTGMRSGEVRGLTWDSIDLEGKRLFIERQANRRGEQAATKTESSVRPIPVPAYLIPELKRWKLACPITARGLLFPGEPNADGERNPIDADILLRNILRRALRKAGLPPLRFHDLRHMAGTLMHEAGVPLKRAQEILGHASERTTLAIYTHSMRRTHDDSADKIAIWRGSHRRLRTWETLGKQMTPWSLKKLV